MDKPSWTYEVPPAAADAVGLEDYEVESVVGEPLGRVKGEEVEEVEHDSLTVRLRVQADELHRKALLDAGRAVEGGEAEAVRVTDVPGEPRL